MENHPRDDLDESGLAAGIAALRGADPRVDAAVAQAGPPPLRRWAEGFSTLLDVIIGQQVSTASAKAIKARLWARLGPPDPLALLAQSDADLRACGLSRQKITYSRAIAAAIAEGRLDPAALRGWEDEAVIAALTALPGIGRWTAEIYLLFALGRRDVFPAADLALAVAYQRLAGLADRPRERALREAVAPWAPWRGAGAHLLWHLYRAPDFGNQVGAKAC